MAESIKSRRARLAREKEENLKIDAMTIASQLSEQQQLKIHEYLETSVLFSIAGKNLAKSFMQLVNNDSSLSLETKAACVLLARFKALRKVIKSSSNAFIKYKKDKAEIEKIETEIMGYFKNRGGWTLETQDDTITQFYVKTVHKTGAIVKWFVIVGVTNKSQYVIVKSAFDSLTKKPIGDDDVKFFDSFKELVFLL